MNVDFPSMNASPNFFVISVVCYENWHKNIRQNERKGEKKKKNSFAAICVIVVIGFDKHIRYVL